MAPTYRVAGFIFDIITVIVSLLDLSTDLIILLSWYAQGRMEFFWISLSILLLAQLSHVTLFYYNHGRMSDHCCHTALSVLCTLPFAPFLSFIFYLVADTDSKLRAFIERIPCFTFEWGSLIDTNSSLVDANSTPQQQYAMEKLYRHLGFLLEHIESQDPEKCKNSAKQKLFKMALQPPQMHFFDFFQVVTPIKFTYLSRGVERNSRKAL